MTQDTSIDGNRVVLVTGAASGMGLVAARTFLAGGDHVVAWDIDAAGLEAAWGGAPADRVLADAVNVGDPDSCAAGSARLLAAFGRLDVVVNNAALHGSPWLGNCLDLDLDGWQRIFGVNVLGPVNVMRATADALASSSGVVINISSMVAYGRSPSSPYAVSKAALNGVTVSLADELGRRGVRVLGLAPGFIATDTVINSIGMDRVQAILAEQSVPTMGQPADIAGLLVVLASEQGRMIAGQTVVADAGFTRRP